MPDSPNELVEAAAKALREERNTPGVGDPSPWEHATPASRSAYCREARSALAAVLPLIEQRVIDRLAKQAGTNPYADADSVDFDPYMRDGWFEGAACGVAAERARIRRLIATLYDGPPAQHPVIVEILEALEDK